MTGSTPEATDSVVERRNNDDRGTTQLHRYFERYPGRDRGLGAKLFRRGERERYEVVKAWMPNCQRLRVLDAGCGDGDFLRRLIRGRPLYLRLEDFVDKWVTQASRRLAGVADQVEAVVVDVRAGHDSSQYDIVLALGLFDYEADWPLLLQRLISRTRGSLFVDFPKTGTLHHFLRRSWLRWHGVRLNSTDRTGLDTLLAGTNTIVSIEELPLQWVVRLDISA